MVYGTLKDYAPRLGLYPSYKAPKYLGKDIEFAYFEFRVPHLWRDILKDPDNAEFEDRTGVLPVLWWNDIITLPVYAPVEESYQNETFIFFKCRVPMCIMKSSFGLGYFAPNMQFNNEMAPPTPDHIQAADRAREKVLKEEEHKGQWELTLRCNARDEDGDVCGREVTEVHDSATEGLTRRYCGQCDNTKLQLVKLKPVKEGA
jgi:hypothetical protein